MSAKTKIVVLHMKEVVYTIVFLVLALLLGVLLFLMFAPKKADSSVDGDARYQPGVYTSTIAIHENTFDVEVTVDSSRIKAIRLVNLSESTTAMFPLMQPTLDELASQIYTTQSLDNISYSEENRYTSLLLINAISTALKKAEV